MSSLGSPERLGALLRSGLANMDDDRSLTHICYSAVQLLGCDAAQVNAITSRSQLFISEWPRVGPRQANDLSNSGCREVVLAEHTLVIPNTLEHPVMCRMPWVADWGAYLGAPLVFEGQTIGSLCALSVMPRRWTTHEVLALESLASLVADKLLLPLQPGSILRPLPTKEEP